MRRRHERRLYHPWKLPIAIGFVAACLPAVVVGAHTAQWSLVIAGGLGAAYFGLMVAVILEGKRNPWWMRSRLDPPTGS